MQILNQLQIEYLQNEIAKKGTIAKQEIRKKEMID